AGDLLEDRLVRIELAALIDVADLHRVAEPERPGVRLFLSRNHPEERRLSRAVRSDDADDAAARQREADVVHQQQVAVAFPYAARLDDDVAQTRPGRDVDLDLFDLLRGLFLQQVFVMVQARLPLGLPRARGHADPFELALEGLLAPRLGLLFLRETVLLLL